MRSGQPTHFRYAETERIRRDQARGTGTERGRYCETVDRNEIRQQHLYLGRHLKVSEKRRKTYPRRRADRNDPENKTGFANSGRKARRIQKSSYAETGERRNDGRREARP